MLLLKMGIYQILLISLKQCLLQNFFNKDVFKMILQIPLPRSELYTLLLHWQVRWKLKPAEDSPKLKQTIDGKILPKTVILVKLLIHLTFASFCLFDLNRSGFWCTAPWLKWFQYCLKPVGWDSPLHRLTNLRSALSRSCNTQGRNSSRH